MRQNDSGHALMIGEKLRAARSRDKLSLRELAARTEISASMLSQIETGKVYPSVRSMYHIASALGLPVDYFFPETEVGPPQPPALEELTENDLDDARSSGALDEIAFGFVIAKPLSPVVHPGERPAISLKGGVAWARLTAQAQENGEFLEITYAPGATSGAGRSHHAGREFGLILEGELVLELGFERYTLREGDSIMFDSTIPHRLTNGCTRPMRALWIVLAPREAAP
jgi:transcriptional regulator with XRE-family HTH domain